MYGLFVSMYWSKVMKYKTMGTLIWNLNENLDKVLICNEPYE